MANFTPNVNLEKPLGSEHYLIPKFNANMDKIDTKFGELQNLGGIISGATVKATPVDADTLALSDSAATSALKKLSWLNIKATLKAYFDTLYATIANLNLKAPLANPVFTGTQTLPNIVTNGIKFPATQIPSADPNTLYDYEEGTFTPYIFGLTTAGVGTYTTQNGIYVKIGKLVYFKIRLAVTNHTGTGIMIFAQLPFNNDAVADTPISVNVNLLTFTGQLSAIIAGNGNNIFLPQVSSGNNGAFVNIYTNFSIELSGTYTTV